MRTTIRPRGSAAGTTSCGHGAARAVGVCDISVAATATNGRLQAGGPAYKVAGTFGKEGTGNGQFCTNVTGLAVDAAGNVYVADGNLKRIQAFSAKGHTFGTTRWSTPAALPPTSPSGRRATSGAQQTGSPRCGGSQGRRSARETGHSELG